MNKRKNFIIIGLVLIFFVFFISGKETAISVLVRPHYVAADNIFHDIRKIYAAKKSKELDSIFSKYHKLGIFNGTVIYGEQGREIFKKAYGYSDLRKKDSLSTSSAFQLASVSKMFTATAIMILHERGKLKYDDPITVYIPEFPYGKVTIRHLLNHRSGLTNYMYLADDKWNVETPISNEDVIDLFEKYEPDNYFQPDKGFQYNNTNYALLASVVERITGKTFAQFTEENIFDPLGMDDSFVYCLQEDTLVGTEVPVGVPGYQTRNGKFVKMENSYLNGVTGDKGVYSSVDDLFKFNQALDNGSLVNPLTLQEAFTEGSPQYHKRKDNYGFGWRIRNEMDSTVYHFGWWKGFRTYYIRDMRNSKALIVLSNTTKGFPSEVLWQTVQDNTTMQELLSVYEEIK